MCNCENKLSFKSNSKLKASLDKESNNNAKGLLQSDMIVVSGCCDLDKYSFLTGDAPDTVDVNLWEQAKLNYQYGLYRVSDTENDKMDGSGKYILTPGDVFQIRGYDISNMTIVYDGIGWIVMDVMTTTKIAETVWRKIVQHYLSDDKKINLVIYSHSHVDHYGGIGGLKEFFAEDCRILAPEGFTEHAVSENVYVGTTMSRRAAYQMGSLLTPGKTGHIDCGLGKLTTKGGNSIIVPTKEIGFDDYDEDKRYYTTSSGTITLQIQFTPGTEAPAEMNVYLPNQKLMFIAENCAATLHNALTPRGAQVRDLLAWAEFLDETIVTFSDMETLCAAHNWPRFGKEECIRFLEIQRDMYRFVNNATLHLVNLGYTIDEVGRLLSDPNKDGEYLIPEDFINEWCCHGYYGTFNHDAKAVYQRYIGWYDGNPAHLNRLSPAKRASKYVEAFTAEKLYEQAEKAHANKEYEWSAELCDYIMNAKYALVDSEIIRDTRTIYADSLRQLGFQSEAATWRNMYLMAAQEIEQNSIIMQGNLVFENDTVNAMTVEMILQYLGIMLNCWKARQNGITMAAEIHSQTVEGTQKIEYVNITVGRGILNYRIVNKSEELNKDAAIKIVGTKQDFFRAFVDKDSDAQKAVVSDKQQLEVAKKFIDEYFTVFPIGFPIMTPRDEYKGIK